MKRRHYILIGIIAAVILGLVLLLTRSAINGRLQVKYIEGCISNRVKVLDRYVGKALSFDAGEWMDLGEVPPDLVIYRYVDDTLTSWANQFPIGNDKSLSTSLVMGRMLPQRNSVLSPLVDVQEDLRYLNLGPKWYLAKRVETDNVSIIAGIEVVNGVNPTHQAVKNPRLHIPQRFSLSPVTDSEGIAVSYQGRPLFSMSQESINVYRGSDNSPLFSPAVYSGGGYFRSLGPVVITNLIILLVAVALFLMRRDLASRIRSAKGRRLLILGVAVAITGILVYTHISVRSIIQNSTIPLELYKISDLTPISGMVYASFITMLLSVPLLWSVVRPMNPIPRVLFAVGVGAYFLAITAIMGINKEQNRLMVWADRLAVDRDLKLEMQLMRTENRIARDAFIPALSLLDSPNQSIQNRLVEMHFSRIAQDYDISVRVVVTQEDAAWCADRIAGGIPIADRSRFVSVNTGTGRGRYDGLFIYNTAAGRRTVLVEVEPHEKTADFGYSRIFDLSSPGEVVIPVQYSYARYISRDLRGFKGNFSYPTALGNDFLSEADKRETSRLVQSGYVHFVNKVDDDEVVVISRQTIPVFDYVIAGSFVAVIVYLLTLLCSPPRKKERDVTRDSFKSRISLVMQASLVATLVTMGTVSILFVYQRNQSYLHSMLTTRVNSVHSLIASRIRGLRTTEDLRSAEVKTLLDLVSEDIGSDITLYSPDGKVMMTTRPEVFNQMYLGSRINEHAYNSILHLSHRYFIHREHAGPVAYYGLYSPLVAEDGSVAAVIGSPYSEDGYEMREDAVSHFAAILTVFLILLLLGNFTMKAVLARMFKPIGEMSRKMAEVNLDSMEHIEYDRDDEISLLVRSYNRMVDDLAESSKLLAQAERDKAWSGMARQVAHEIKNPLTPMKLQLQRLIRLKGKDDPSWQDRFDEVSKVLLDHIDILSDTANEFSTFSKLYTEEHTVIDLDEVLKEEISMFDSKEDVHFDYYGFSGVKVSGPKPQLIRVFVNLINNAVQSLSGRTDGRIMISLRNSSLQEGYYDIVFEDNGDGVAPENVGKLFMPNFTTKNGGSGLGLAISRSILEKCGATISYSRSFALGGACFTIKYPYIRTNAKTSI